MPDGAVAADPGMQGAQVKMAKSKGAAEDGVVTIKKYANRRLYDTERSCYITLEDLGTMVRDGRDFRVVDAKSGDDITHNVLTQIIMDEETRGETLLPVNFLRHLIGMYGDKMQSMVPQYLEASMTAFPQESAGCPLGARRRARLQSARRTDAPQHGNVPAGSGRLHPRRRGAKVRMPRSLR
jgi:polyhydroxyalkanoate synthesis repressor PhaR